MEEVTHMPQEGSHFESIEQVQEALEEYGFCQAGIILQPDSLRLSHDMSFDDTADLAIAAVEDIEALEEKHGAYNVILVPAPDDPELFESRYRASEHKLVFIKFPRET